MSGRGMRWVLDAIETATPETCQLYPFTPSQRYGLVHVDGRNRLVHHVVMDIVGILPAEGETERRHTCGRTRCANWYHLRWGTHSENERDKRGHGWTPPVGEANANARLTADDVRTIRESTDSQRALAVRFGVSPRTIRRVLRRENWQHVP